MGCSILKRNGKEYKIIKREKILDKVVFVTEENESKSNTYVLFPEDDESHKGMAVPKKAFEQGSL